MDTLESSETAMEESAEPISIEASKEHFPVSETTEKNDNIENTPEQQAFPPAPTFESHRAKAFILNTESNDWDEMATGICSPEPSEDGEVFAIRLRAEEDTTLVLFTAYFHKGQEIGVQNDTVLTWTTSDGDEAALSFESSVGCEEFWKLICRFYGKSFEEWKLKQQEQQELEEEEQEQQQDDEDSSNNNMLEDKEMKTDDFYDDSDGFCGMYETTVPKIEIAFPEKPEISSLTEIEDGLNQAFLIPSLRRQISEILIQYKYIPALLEIFQHCEQFGMLEDLQKLFRIFKLFFLLNGQELLKELMAESNYLLIAGVMEYDPLLGHEPRINLYRSFLSGEDRFKQVVPLNNKDILTLIHQTFRLQYFKDVILARILDEESSAAFILLIRINHMAIINAIDNDPEVLEVIKKLLQDTEMPLNDQINVMKFFKEFVTIAKTVTLRKSLQIYQNSVVNDFMKFITRVLNTKTTSEETSERVEKINESKLLAIGLFTNIIQHDPSQIRTYLIQNDSHCIPKNLLNTVIDMFTDPETCSPIRWQLVTALKILLDTFNPTVASTGLGMMNPQLNAQVIGQALAQKSGEDFLNHFYPDYACRLLRPLIDFDKTAFLLQGQDGVDFFFKENLSTATCEILFHLGELLCNFIGQHKYRIKYLVLRNLILQNALLLLKCREKHLQLTGLRIFRATLAVEDEFYFRFFIQHRSFNSILLLYRASGGAECDNLVTSAILDIFEFIRVPRDSLKALVRHLATIYRSDLESLGPACVFRGILETEDRIDRESSVVSFASSQNSLQSDQEMSPASGQHVQDQGVRSESFKDEEDYFSESNVEDDNEDSSRFKIVDQDDSVEGEPEEIMFRSSRNSSTDENEEDDHFEFLLKKSSSTSDSPGSPTKKTKH